MSIIILFFSNIIYNDENPKSNASQPPVRLLSPPWKIENGYPSIYKELMNRKI